MDSDYVMTFLHCAACSSNVSEYNFSSVSGAFVKSYLEELHSETAAPKEGDD